MIFRQMSRRPWAWFVFYVSWECLLKKKGANGGGVILARAILIAIELTAMSLLLSNIVDPVRTGSPSLCELRTQLVQIAPWFAGATGAAYVALYARFSAQWSYLAGLYNQIKQAELEMSYTNPKNKEGQKRLAEWKAAYIEDAYALHLHAKENVAVVVYHWGNVPAVAKAFANGAAGGETLWNKIHGDAARAYVQAAQNI